MRVIELLEYRKNPEQNPKISVNKPLIDIVNHTTDEIVPGIKNSFTSFTKLEKLGINPNSIYDTPLGIYSYPTEYITQTIGPDTPLMYMEFAGDSPFVNVFKVKGTIIHLNSMDESLYESYKENMTTLLQQVSGQSYKNCTQIIEELLIEGHKDPNAFLFISGGRFWYLTWRLSKDILPTYIKSKPIFIWNWIFKKLGINGCIDSGEGIIHKNEKTQAVFFSKEIIYDVKRFNNKTYTNDLKNSQLEILNKITSLDTLLMYLQNGYKPKYYEAVKKFLIPALKQDPNIIFKLNPFSINGFLSKLYLTFGGDGDALTTFKYSSYGKYDLKHEIEKITNYINSLEKNGTANNNAKLTKLKNLKVKLNNILLNK